MPFDNSRTLLSRPDGGLRQKTFRLGAIESRMHAGDIVERLRNPDPARQHGDVGDEADIAHELIALVPRVAPQHPQFPLVWSESEDRVERGGLARAVGTDQSQDAALFDTQIDAVQRDGCAVGLAQTAGFYACHGFSAPPPGVQASTAVGLLRRRPRAIQQFFRLQAKPLDGGLDPRPLFAQKLLPLALQQQAARARH